ncbi:chloroplast stem-loop binding protein of 41 kDa b, chloroplastic [Tanacetum coccineum]
MSAKGITNLVSGDVLEGEDVDVVNANGFDSDPGNDEERNYKKRRLAELRTKMEGVINASGNLKTNSRELEVQISMSKAFKAKAKAEKEIRDYILQYSMLRDYVVELRSTNPNTTVKIAVERNTDPSLPTRIRDLLGLDGAFMKGPFPGQVLVAVGLDSNNRIYPLAYALVEAESKSSWCWFLQCLGNDIDPHPNSNFTFISDRQKGIIRAVKLFTQDLLGRAASATNVRDFKKLSKSDLLLNNICEVFNGKIVGGRDKPVITLLEYIKEYCMKRIVNVQGVIDKCNGPLTPTATRIMKSIKKEAYISGYCMKRIVGRPKKKKERSKHEDEPFVKNGKLIKKERTITCQSCGNNGQNKATCKGQGRKATTDGNNAEASGSASRQAQQTKLAVGQDGSGGSGIGAIIGLSDADGQVGAGGAGGAGVGVGSQAISDNGKFPMVDEEEVTSNKLAPMAEEMIMLIEGLGGGDLRDYVNVVGGTDDGDKGTDVMKDTVSLKNVCEEEVPLNNNIEKQIGDFVDMPSEAVEQRMDANVPDEIDGAKGEQVPNHVVKKGNLEFLVCKEVANPGVNEHFGPKG